VAASVLQQTPVECLAEEEALGSEYLPEAESPQAAQAPLPLLVAVEAEDQPPALRVVEKLQPLSGGLLKQFRVQSRNTNEEGDGK
jgi:hypothetical protein